MNQKNRPHPRGSGRALRRFLRLPAALRAAARCTCVLAGLAAIFAMSPPVAAAGITFNFTLSAAGTTSAGVYDANGQLVKTLWRKTAYAAGAQSALWDGTKDDGTVAPNGTYRIKVLSHNVGYVWEGIIGNTHTSFTSVNSGGDTVWHGYDSIADMAILGTNIFIANGYAEGNANAYRATTSTPNTPKQMVFGGNIAGAAIQFKYTATDGTWTYFAAGEGGFNNASCVLAYKVSDNSPATFTHGVSYQPMPWSATYPSVIDFTPAGSGNTSVNPPTGLTVQQSGSILAVAHGGANEVRLFHKTSGQSLGSIAIASPRRVAFHPSTGDLWVISGTAVRRFTAAQVAGVTTSGVALTPTSSITGLNAPLAVAVDPRSGVDLVLVVDGGTSQQVKGYTSAGATASGWTAPLGLAGGYNATNGNNVANTKFRFVAPAFVAIQSDGSFWVGDVGNERSLRFSAARAYLEQIAFQPAMYALAVDANAPTRVIASGWYEYTVDYTKPLQPGDPAAAGGNNSWKLVRNWAVGMPADYFTGSIAAGINTVVTLHNGRTYGLVYYFPASQWEVVELPATGLLRLTGIRFPDYTTLYPNGDLRRPDISGGVQTIYNRRLTGFDASGNPQWAPETVLASAPAGAQTPHYRWKFAGPAGPQFPLTASNVVVSFDQSVSEGDPGVNTGMHLGGMLAGGASWRWQASPAASVVDFYVSAQQNGAYCIGDNTNYGGNKVLAAERHVIYGYHGEGWRNQQANQFTHFHDDGLFIGQFGVPNPNTVAMVGVAGNSFSSALVRAAGNWYLYHNDESNHGGVHRWRIDGLGSIVEQAGSGVFAGGSTTITLSTLAAAPAGPTAVPGNAQVSLSWVASAGATSYNIYRGTTPSGQGTAPVHSGVSGTALVDTGLTNGVTYYYKVVAVNSGGAGAFSAEASARPSASAALYQAESGTRTNGASLYNDASASNGQGVGGMNGSLAPGVTISSVNGGSSGGAKTLLIRYACPAVSSKNLYVNGVKITKLTFPSTGSFGGSPAAYGTIATPITLASGNANTIAIINDNYDPYGVNLDFFSVD